MKDFISYIKNISTEEFVEYWGNVSSQIYKKQFEKDINSNEMSGTLTILYPILYAGFIRKSVPLTITAWDITDMIYTSVMVSNDYRKGSMTEYDAPCIVNLYRKYEDDEEKIRGIKEMSFSDLMKFVMGMTYEQFKFQNLSWTIQNFNRNYHMLIASNYINREGILDINNIVKERFAMGVDELIANELFLLWFSTMSADPLHPPHDYLTGKVDEIVTLGRMAQIAEYYSVDYETVRKCHLKKQIFYTKPFLRTQKTKKYLVTNVYLLQMVFANGLYWIIRDYYYENKMGQAFINYFGLMFEQYFEELSGIYLDRNMWGKIQEKKEKSADYYVEFDDVLFIFELKSGLLGINAQQQNPDIAEIDKFYDRNIYEAYEQLKNSEKDLAIKGKQIVKIFLLYEFTNNTQIMMLSMPELFEADNNLYIMSILDLEMLLATYKHNRESFLKVIQELKDMKSCEERISFLKILDDNGATGNLHFIDERDYFDKILHKMKFVPKVIPSED